MKTKNPSYSFVNSYLISNCHVAKYNSLVVEYTMSLQKNEADKTLRLTQGYLFYPGNVKYLASFYKKTRNFLIWIPMRWLYITESCCLMYLAPFYIFYYRCRFVSLLSPVQFMHLINYNISYLPQNKCQKESLISVSNRASQ